MEVFTMAGLIALIVKFTSVAKYIQAKDWRNLATQVFVWLVACIAAFLAVNANAFEHVDINGVALMNLNNWSVVLLGLGLGSLGSTFVDYKKARDNTDSAVEPDLFSPNTTGRTVLAALAAPVAPATPLETSGGAPIA